MATHAAFVFCFETNCFVALAQLPPHDVASELLQVRLLKDFMLWCSFGTFARTFVAVVVAAAAAAIITVFIARHHYRHGLGSILQLHCEW